MKNIKTEIGKTPKIAILTFILLFTLLISLGGAIILRNWALVILTIVIAVLISLPKFIEKWSNIAIPDVLEAYTIIFLYATLFLGELKNYYATYWWWDILLHTSSALAFGIIGFIILYVLYKSEKVKTSPKTIAMFSFAFALAMGALWEIAEFGIDTAFHTTRMQGGSLTDTMGDLIVDSLGALFSAVMGYLYLKREAGIVVEPMMKEFKKDNPKIFKKKESKNE